MSTVRRIALVQRQASADPSENLARAKEGIREAADRGAKIVCLQELFLTPYFPQTEDSARFDLAESIPGPTTDALQKLAADLQVVLIAPIFERRAAGLYHNSAVVIDANGSQAGLYRKMHIPDDPLFYEKFYFTPGDLGFRCFDTRAGRIGVLICWDQWFPEAARMLALDGAEILFCPSAIGWQDDDSDEENAVMRDSWITVQRGHAIANGIFTAALNRVGREGAVQFWGSSFVCDPRGEVLAQSPVEGEDVLLVDCNLESIEKQRRGWPFLRDRRIDAYDDLLERFRN
ncbi:MAG: carbon-nitrogen hydrolase [bacterium]|nr:carbon-nitrogen hydrolase [bacterium]